MSELEIDTSDHDFTVGSQEVLIQVNNIKARDIHSAKAKADSKLELINTLFSLFHHKKAPDFQHDCLVINVTNGEVNRSRKALNVMHKCVDLKPPEAARKMNAFISDFSLEKISFQKFTRSAELHALALNSDSIAYSGDGEHRFRFYREHLNSTHWVHDIFNLSVHDGQF